MAGERQTPKHVLTEIFDRFAEGFATGDLEEAKAPLAEPS
jgi:hypothetical protein